MEDISIKVWYTEDGEVKFLKILKYYYQSSTFDIKNIFFFFSESFFVSLKNTEKLFSLIIAIKTARNILEINNLKLCCMNGDVLFWGEEREKYGNPTISEMIKLGWMDFEGTNQIVLHYDHQGITSQKVQICSTNDTVKKIITGDRNFFQALDIDSRIFKYRLQKKNIFSVSIHLCILV